MQLQAIAAGEAVGQAASCIEDGSPWRGGHVWCLQSSWWAPHEDGAAPPLPLRGNGSVTAPPSPGLSCCRADQRLHSTRGPERRQSEAVPAVLT